MRMFEVGNDNGCVKAGTVGANKMLKVLNILTGGCEDLEKTEVGNSPVYGAVFV